MERLFSWEVTSFVVGLAISIGLGVLALDDYKLAKLFFLLAAADASGGVVMWGLKTDLPPLARNVVVFVIAGAIAVLLVQSLKYVDRKQTAKRSGGPTGASGASTDKPIPTPEPPAAPSSSSSRPIANRTETGVAKPVIADVRLMFKETALLTPKRQSRITKDVNEVAHYLKVVGIPVPDDIPPISVDTKNPKGEGWSFNSQSDNKYYYNQFTLQQRILDEPTKITEAFLSFAVGRFIYKPPPPVPPNLGQMTPQEFWDYDHTPEMMDRAYRWMTSVVIVQYLNHSYWNRPFAENERPACPDQGNGMSYYFWQMREHFGKDFVDRLAVFTLRATVDKPYTGTHADATHPYRHYFYERLTLADSVIDNEGSRMPEIDTILKDCDWLPLT